MVSPIVGPAAPGAVGAERARSRPALAVGLLLIVILAVSLRSASLGALHGKYALDNDSYRFMRIAEADAAGGPIGARDMMRWLPAGRDMTTYLSLHSILISRLYRAARGLGYRGSFRAFALRYPVFCFALCIGVLYLLLARYVSPIAGLIGAVGLAVAPTTIYRSSAGFVDRDPTCLLLVLATYIAYSGVLCEQRAMASYAAAALCGVLSAVLGLAWEGVGLFTVAFAVTLAWAAMTGRLTVRLLLCHVAWCVIAIPPLVALTRAYRDPGEAHVALALFPVPFVCMSSAALATLRALGRRSRAFAALRTCPPAVLFPLCALGLLAAGAAVALRLSPGVAAAGPAMLENAASTFGRNRVMRQIGELRNMFLPGWWTYYGPSLLLFLGGAGLVASDLGLARPSRQRALGILTVLCSVVVLASNDLSLLLRPPAAGLPGGVDGGLLGGGIRLSMLPLWFLGAISLTTPVAREDGRQRQGRDALAFFLSLWWVTLLTAAAGADRHNFFLAPAGWALAGVGLARLYGWRAGHGSPDERGVVFWSAMALPLIIEWGLWAAGRGLIRTVLHTGPAPALDLATLVLASAGLALFLLRGLRSGPGDVAHRRGALLASGAAVGLLCFAAAWSVARAARANASLRPEDPWLIPYLEAMARRFPSRAVVLGWRDYGSEINVLAQRATVIDEDDYGQEPRIAEVARETYCSRSAARAHEFMARNGITHWLITDADLHMLTNIAWIGREPVPPAEFAMCDFIRTTGGPLLPPGRLRFLPARGHPELLADRLTLEGLGRPAGPAYLVAAYLQFAGPGKTDLRHFTKAQVVLSIGGTLRRLRPETVVFLSRAIRQRRHVMPGALIVDGSGPGGPIRVTYVPRRATECLAVRLFALNEKLPQFREVPGIGPPARPGALAFPLARVWAVSPPARGPSVAPLRSRTSVPEHRAQQGEK